MSSDRPVAIVTGAAQGIGRRTAEVLATAGFALALVDVQDCDDHGLELHEDAGVLTIRGDVCDEEFGCSVARGVAERFERADVLVNNAGISSIAPAEAIEAAEWKRVMDVNLFGPFILCREFGRMMLAHGSGSIINVASIAGLQGIGHRAAYNSSKHGLVGLTRTLAAEWGGRGVRVNAVCPGWVKTPMDDSATAAGLYTDADIIGRIPMGRFATVDDVAQAILFLADDAKSGFVNGHCLSVDGGWYGDGGWNSLRIAGSDA